MSLFSIIVPVYKAEKYLDDCIKSLLKQTITDFEVILVDDGSPDRSGEICDDYSEKYKFIKTIHKKNEGLVSARKAGAKVAVGKYIVCVDSDDWVDDGYLEKFYTIIKRFQPDIICSGMKRVFGEKSKKVQIKQRSGFYSKSQIEEEIFPILIQGENGSTFMPNIAVKCIERNLYVTAQMTVNNQIKISEDKSVTVPCIYRSNSLFVTKYCGYNYRINEESMTDRKRVFPWNGPKLVSEHLRGEIDIELYDFEQQIDRFIVHALFNVIVSQFNSNKKYKSVVKEIKNYIEKPYYKKAIKNGKFNKYWPGILARFVLLYRMIWLSKIYYYKKYYL